MQFEPEDYRKNTLVNSLQQLAAGIGGQLQQRKQRHETATGLQSLGIPEQQANAMAAMDPKSREMGMKNLLEQQHQGQLKQSMMGLEGMKPSWADYLSRAGEKELPANMQLLASMEDYNQQKQGEGAGGNVFENPQIKIQRAALEERRQSHLAEAERKKQKDLSLEEEHKEKREFEKDKFEYKKKIDSEILKNKQAIFRLQGKMTAAQEQQHKDRIAKLEHEKDVLEQRKYESSSIRNEKAEAATRKYRDEVSTSAKLAHENDMRLGQMENLAKEDKLVHPAMYWAAKKAGLPTSMFSDANTELFEELTNNFLRGARSMFGGRVTNLELEKFLSTIPSLKNSREGKLKIIKNLQIYNSLEEEYNDVMNEIIEKNGGKYPLDLKVRVDKAMGPAIKKAYDSFIKI